VLFRSVKLKNTHTGDTLCDARDPIILSGIEVPDPVHRVAVVPKEELTDMDWEVFPSGLHELLVRLGCEYRPEKIYITENGTCDFTDAFRGKFIIDHLARVKRLVDDGVAVERYCHWSLMDNFELAEGLKYRFGLIHVDFDTLKRSIKKSGKLYADIISKRKVTKKMINAHRDEY